ncbi:hypothetical protein [Aureimonas sp. SK2]|uniref:hypothetical protein n=1 Tax=Aureimonas sp. SK2 TaxID=3015992 RepID=UPI0024451A7F|nr:hypothetical protein [Aureimonas sp. SK2]
MNETHPSEDDLKLLKRYWPHVDRADPNVIWAIAEEIYDGREKWEVEFATDLVRLKPRDKGGRATGKRIDRMAMKRWRSGENDIPEWLAVGLPRLPGFSLARRLADLSLQGDALRAEEARLAAWVAAQVERYVPSVERDPTPRPPPPRPPTPDREWPSVSPEEIEAAEDIGSLAARVEMGVVEPEAAPRPEHPVLADAWERGWGAAYEWELSRVREVAAAAEAERAAKAKVQARREARRAADLKRRLRK